MDNMKDDVHELIFFFFYSWVSVYGCLRHDPDKEVNRSLGQAPLAVLPSNKPNCQALKPGFHQRRKHKQEKYTQTQQLVRS